MSEPTPGRYDTALAEAQARADAAEAAHRTTAEWLDAMRHSTSWRITAPLRRIMQRRASMAPAVPPAHAIAAPLPHPPRAVHQFHAGVAVGDAITNAMLLTRRLLRELGYESHIYAVQQDPALDDIRPLDTIPVHRDYVLLLRHSMGHDALDRVLALPVRKILLYHNITPPHLLVGQPYFQDYARLGRAQLHRIRPAVDAALADSEYNAIELRRAGFGTVAACTLLFDLAALEQRALPRSSSCMFTILFVGRIAPSKGQLALVEAFARFRQLYHQPCRLVLAGRMAGDAYADAVRDRVRALDLTDDVSLPGLVPDADLHRLYATADLYVSASAHEGFGVPLVEAVAAGLPVVAVAAGAVPYTLAGSAGLVASDSPELLAFAMLAWAGDAPGRARLLAQQRESVQRFALDRQRPALVAAVQRTGGAAPIWPGTRAALMAQARFTVAGHVGGTYSLAAVNRTLAAALDSARPGTSRLLAAPGDGAAGVPLDQRTSTIPLLDRPHHLTGPHVVISQHYPVWVPPYAESGDVLLALFYWEETQVPGETISVLNEQFGGVLAPSHAVAKALIDSGLRIPVSTVGHTPDLVPFEALRAARPARMGPFTFLHISSGLQRKGIDVLLAAYARAFRAGDDVALVIKTTPNIHNTVADDVAALQAADPGVAPVKLCNTDLPAAAIVALYANADAVVLPTRGEGYNLPAAEAMAAGVPLIVTGYGGHMDFVDGAAPGAIRLVAYTMQASGSHLAPPFSLWAEPDEDDLVAAMQEAVVRGQGVLDRLPDPEAGPDIASRIAAFATDRLLALPVNPRPLGMIAPWDVRCGVAEYTRHLLAAMPGPALVLADRRTAPDPDAPHPVYPAWDAGPAGVIDSLDQMIQQQDCRALVLQHHPALILWATLPGILALPALVGRVVCVTLHNTRELALMPAPVRADVIAGLARMSRVVVHTIADINGLAAMGLVHNTVLVPHGVVAQGQGPALRVLDPARPVLIGCHGFFMPHKGIAQLIEALALLRPAWPRARLSLLNATYPSPISAEEIAACRALAVRFGVAPAVTFQTAFLDPATVTSLLRECDLVVLPYQDTTEASSAAMRSALAACVPVAVTPQPLFEEAADAVLRLPGSTPEAIAAGIDAALRDHAARCAAVTAAASWAAERDWTRVGERMAGMLAGLEASGVVAAA